MSDRQELEIRRRIQAAVEGNDPRAELNARRELNGLLGSPSEPPRPQRRGRGQTISPEEMAAGRLRGRQIRAEQNLQASEEEIAAMEARRAERERSIAAGREAGVPMAIADPRARELSQLELMIQESEDINPVEAFWLGAQGAAQQGGANLQQVLGFGGSLLQIPGAREFQQRGAERGEMIAETRDRLAEIEGGAPIAGGVALEASTIPIGMGASRMITQGSQMLPFSPAANVIGQSGLAAIEAGTTIVDHGSPDALGVREITSGSPLTMAATGGGLAFLTESIFPGAARLLKMRRARGDRVLSDDFSTRSPFGRKRQQEMMDSAIEDERILGELTPEEQIRVQRIEGESTVELPRQEYVTELDDSARREGVSEGREAAFEEVAEGELVEEVTPLIPAEGAPVLAQRTQDPFQLESLSFTSQLPENSQKAFEMFSRQNENAARSVGNLLDEINMTGDTLTAEDQFIDFSQSLIDGLKARRRNQTAPLYEEAFRSAREQGFDIDPQSMIDHINFTIRELPEDHAVSRVLRRYRDAITPGTYEEPASLIVDASGNPIRSATESVEPMTLERLQGAGEVAGDMLEGLISATSRGVATPAQSKAARELSIVVDMANQEARRFAPYRRANDLYRELSPAVDRARNSLFGKMALINPDSPTLESTAAAIFRSPRNVRHAREFFEQMDGGDEVMSLMTRKWLEDNIRRSRADIAEVLDGDVVGLPNVARILDNALFGGARREVIREAVGSDLAPAVDSISRHLKRLASGRPGGSQTAIREIIDDNIQGSARGTARFITSPVDGVVGLGEDAARSLKVQSVFDLVTVPEYVQRYSDIDAARVSAAQKAERVQDLLNHIAQRVFMAESFGDLAPLRQVISRRPEEVGEAIDMTQEFFENPDREDQ